MTTQHSAEAIAPRPQANALAAPLPGGNPAGIDIREHTGLVHWTIKRYRLASYLDLTGSFDISDLVQAGLIGLHTAAQKFEPHRGIKFSTYAVHWVRQAVQRFIANHLGVLRVPIHASERARREGKRPYVYAASLDCPTRSLRSTADSGKTTLADLIADDGPAPDAGLEAESARRQVADLLARAGLTPQERRVLQFRVHGGATLRQVGDELGVSRERIRQVEAAALAKMRKAAGVPHVRGSLSRAECVS